MEWETPEFREISLQCEVSSYANAELEDAPTPTRCESESE